jgi:hypothetical protein
VAATQPARLRTIIGTVCPCSLRVGSTQLLGVVSNLVREMLGMGGEGMVTRDEGRGTRD